MTEAGQTCIYLCISIWVLFIAGANKISNSVLK